MIPGAGPHIDWRFDIIFDFTGGQPEYTISGKHDGFPAFEVYLNIILSTVYGNLDVSRIDGGVELLVRGAKDGVPLGFGPLGAIETEGIRINNLRSSSEIPMERW